ncbi:MAG: 2-(1,2-epoxy,2-dihydrophenyl)acetyl-CoA isomerase [Bradyrhizobium sp.]|nr:2-(1,2-epoxy,2-dihydrophenyl)acetyl-CoA isomerase [Bradyrhizobium sp.]
MTYSAITFAHAGGGYRLTLNRPDRLNAFTAAMLGEIEDAMRVVENDPGARALLIAAAGRGFCAGQDLGQRDVMAGPLDLGATLERYLNPLVRQFASLPIPVLCAVNGVAAGAGVNLALACDLVVAKKSARFVQAFSAIGLVPDAGGSWHLPRLMGPARAMRFSLLGEALSAEDAERCGLISRVIADEDFESEVETIFARLCNGPTHGFAQTKRLMRNSWNWSLDQALDAERDAQRSCGLASDYGEGISAFKEKRPPCFTGDAPPG